MGVFRIARYFEIEAGHRLAKHPEKCRHVHGHSYKIEVVVAARQLDESDMVCDYKALKIVVQRELELLDHALLLAPGDPLDQLLTAAGNRVVCLPEGDPTTEVLARHVFRRVRDAFRPGVEVTSEGGATYRVPPGVVVDRVRVWETSGTWAEYLEEAEVAR